MDDAGGPVFALTLHRSGGTVLARMLNCHPGLVIWGEHAGFINQLAALDDSIGRFDAIASPPPAPRLRKFAQSKTRDEGKFEPWIHPFDRAEFRRWCGDFIEQTFARHLAPGQRWGFKEIRYHSMALARFLVTLFPNCRLVILRRDLTELCVSNLLALWTMKALKQAGVADNETLADQAIADCAYALTTVDAGLAEIAETFPDRTISLSYRRLSQSPFEEIERVFEFLGLETDSEVRKALDAAWNVKSGATDKSKGAGALTRETIERLAPRYLAAARAEIAAGGQDLARLRRLCGRGRFSFVAGDHALRDTPYSSMF